MAPTRQSGALPLRLCGTLTIPYRLDGQGAFDSIMDTWQAAAPDLFPTHADAIEPVRRVFDLGDREHAQASWGHGIWIARRAKPKLEANVVTGSFFHAHLSITIEHSNAGLAERLGSLMTALAGVTGAHYGMIHPLTTAETEEARASRRPDLMTINRVTGRATLGVGYTRQLEKGIPSLYWQNLFGASYVELFGRERLLNAPVAMVNEEAWGIVLQVSEHPPGDDTWEEFRSRRDAALDYLGRDAFWPIGSQVPSEMHDFEPPPLVTLANS